MDHQPLKWLMKFDKLTSKLARLALMLQEYDFKVVHKSGLVNIDAYRLNRNPCLSQKDSTGGRRRTEEDEEEMLGWHALMYLSFLVANGDSSNGASIEIEAGEEFESAKDVFDDGLVLYYLRQKELVLDVISKEIERILQQSKRFE